MQNLILNPAQFALLANYPGALPVEGFSIGASFRVGFYHEAEKAYVALYAATVNDGKFAVVAWHRPFVDGHNSVMQLTREQYYLLQKAFNGKDRFDLVQVAPNGTSELVESIVRMAIDPDVIEEEA